MVLESFFDSPKNIVQAFRFLYSDYSNVDCILKNIGNSSICNLLRNCLVGVKVSDATSDDRVSSNVLYYRVDIVNSIAEIMLASDVEEEIENCSIILKQLLWDRQIILDAGYLIRMVILDSKGFTKLIDRICSSVGGVHSRKIVG